ncbi:MAG: PAS domain S-box protein [Thermoplasmata archaeon]
MKILHVDENESVREKTKNFLENRDEDFSVDNASSIENALKKLKDGEYDAVVSEYELTDGDGLEILKKMNENSLELPFILFTKKCTEEQAIEALDLGAERYLRKGRDEEKDLELLRRALVYEMEHYEDRKYRQLQETYFKDLFENSPEPIVLLDNEDIVLRANKAFEETFYYDGEKIKGEKINDLIVPDDRIEEANSTSEKVLSDQIISFETKRKRKDGTLVDVLVLGYPIDLEEEQVGVFGIYRDISERKERERKIKELYKILGDLGRCSSEEEVFEMVLDSAKEILGFRSSSIMEVDDDKFVTRATIAKNLEKGDQFPIDSAIRGLTYKNQESYLIDDLSQWEEAEPSDPEFKSVISIPIDERGIFQAISYEKGYFDEIDLELAEILITHTKKVLEGLESQRELRRSEEKYRTIFESANDAIFTLEDYEFIDCNKKIEEVFGVDREDILGNNPWDFSPEKQPNGKPSKEKAKEMIDKARGGKPESFEWVHEKEDGTQIYTEVSLNRYQIDEKDFVMAIVRDITKRKETKIELEERNKKIRNLHRKASEFEKCETEDEILENIIDASQRILNFKVCSLDMVEDGEFEVKATIGGVQKQGTSYPIEGIAGKTYESGESILIKDLDKEEDAKPKRESYKSAISVPVSDFGVFQVLSEEKDAFDERDLELTEILVNHGAEAIGRLRFENALIEKNRKIKRIHDTAIEMEKCSSEGEVFDLTLEAVEEVLDIYDYTLALYDEDEEEFVIGTSFRGEYEEGSTLPKELGYLGKTFETQKSFLIEDILEDEIAKPATEKYKSAISLPISQIGVFQAMSTERGYYDQDDLEMLETLFSHTYQVIKRIKGEEEIRQSKNRYRAIFENTGTATIIVEPDGTISLANKKAERLARFYEGSIEGRKYAEFTTEEDQERIRKYHKERLKDPEVVPNEYDFQLKTNKGDVKDVHVSLNIIPGTQRIVASLVDITEKKDLKRKENQLKSELDDLFDDLERIKTYIDTLDIENMDESSMERIETIKKLVDEDISELKEEK